MIAGSGKHVVRGGQNYTRNFALSPTLRGNFLDKLRVEPIGDDTNEYCYISFWFSVQRTKLQASGREFGVFDLELESRQ